MTYNMIFKVSVSYVICMALTAVVLTTTCSAQEVKITEESGIGRVMDFYINYNKGLTEVDGYRIQIIATQDLRRMEDELSSFRYAYPHFSTRTEYVKPYYKIQVGAFIEKLDARRALKKIKKKYTSAYIVFVSDINPHDML